MWTIEECGCFQDDWGRPEGWAVIDEDGAEIEFFRNLEDAEEWLAERLVKTVTDTVEYS